MPVDYDDKHRKEVDQVGLTGTSFHTSSPMSPGEKGGTNVKRHAAVVQEDN